MSNPIPPSLQTVQNDYAQFAADYAAGNQGNYQKDFTKLQNDLKTLANDPSVPQFLKDYFTNLGPTDGVDPTTYITQNASNILSAIHTEMPPISRTSKDQ